MEQQDEKTKVCVTFSTIEAVVFGFGFAFGVTLWVLLSSALVGFVYLMLQT